MKIPRLIWSFLLIGSFVSLGFAQETKRTASIMELKGEAEVKLMQQPGWIPAKVGMVLGEGDLVVTKADSKAILNLDGGQTATVEMDGDSQLLILELKADEVEKTQATLLDLALGKILIKAQKLHSPESKFEVKTPTSVVGVRGTIFSVQVEALE